MAEYSLIAYDQLFINFGEYIFPLLRLHIDTGGNGVVGGDRVRFTGDESFSEIVTLCNWAYRNIPEPVTIPATQTYTTPDFTITINNSGTGQYVKIIKTENSLTYVGGSAVSISGLTGVRYAFYGIVYDDSTEQYVCMAAGYLSPLYVGVDPAGNVVYDTIFPTQTCIGNPGSLAYSLNYVDYISEYIKEHIIYESTDPYAQDPEGESGTGGGTGTFDGTGDDIDIPGLPTLSAVDTGFITLFNPSAAQLKNLANYMWSTGFDLDTFKKIFADPMDCILGLSIVPVAVPNGGTSTVSVGNISTGVSMTKAATQYVEVDCGTLNVNEYWGAYLDYDPYTQAEIYLPYIGTHPLKVDDIMGKAVRVVYHVDILSGACTAFVKCGDSVLYEFIGQCSSSIPITGNDWTNVINGVISIAGAIGSMVATGGASAPMAAGVIASTAVNSMKPNVEKSGSMSGTGGMLAVQTPYLILTRPRQALPTNQNEFMGYPSFITENLSEISGYTEIESIHLEGISGTEQEISEIESLLKSGVIF